MQKRLEFFDGLRAVAIGFVFLVRPTEIYYFKSAFVPTFDFGELAKVGVCIFFFISGFSIYRRVVSGLSLNSVRIIYLRRFARLLPSMAFLAACLILGALGFVDFGLANPLAPFSWLANTTLVHLK